MVVVKLLLLTLKYLDNEYLLDHQKLKQKPKIKEAH